MTLSSAECARSGHGTVPEVGQNVLTAKSSGNHTRMAALPSDHLAKSLFSTRRDGRLSCHEGHLVHTPRGSCCHNVSKHIFLTHFISSSMLHPKHCAWWCRKLLGKQSVPSTSQQVLWALAHPHATYVGSRHCGFLVATWLH